jgi:hypothetical protein
MCPFSERPPALGCFGRSFNSLSTHVNRGARRKVAFNHEKTAPGGSRKPAPKHIDPLALNRSEMMENSG